MTEKTFQRLQKNVCTAQVQANEISLMPKVLEVVKKLYAEQYPFTASDDATPDDWVWFGLFIA